MGGNSLLKTATLQRRGCDLNPGPSAPESSTLTTRLPSALDNELACLDQYRREITHTDSWRPESESWSSTDIFAIGLSPRYAASTTDTNPPKPQFFNTFAKTIRLSLPETRDVHG